MKLEVSPTPNPNLNLPESVNKCKSNIKMYSLMQPCYFIFLMQIWAVLLNCSLTGFVPKLFFTLCRVHTARFSNSSDRRCFHTAGLSGVGFSRCCFHIARWIRDRGFHIARFHNRKNRRQLCLIRVTLAQCELSKTRSEGIADTSPTPAKYLAC